jgi:hypothetical protein
MRSRGNSGRATTSVRDLKKTVWRPVAAPQLNAGDFLASSEAGHSQHIVGCGRFWFELQCTNKSARVHVMKVTNP